MSLRHTKNTPEEMTVKVLTPGGRVSYTVPVLKDVYKRQVWNRYLSGRCGGIRQGRLSYGNVCGAGCHLFRMDEMCIRDRLCIDERYTLVGSYNLLSYDGGEKEMFQGYHCLLYTSY